MTLLKPCSKNGVARHFPVEDFRTYADPELSRSAPWVEGVCFLPECGRVFSPSRSWQIYCCAGCEAKGKAELRRYGHKAALALLTWRMGKYETNDPAVQATARAARRFVTHVQSSWLADRQARAELRGQG
ncbi:hypothetical protein [Pseudooceanicola sp. MF1-13]|uniref:hypothetical protein n=1 Tax=Pseudooceanicola sp. MF1-13 TaxID=3379095 RepID=UPI003892C83E